MELNFKMTIRTKTKSCITNIELWLYDSDVKIKLDKALDWTERFPPQETGVDELQIQVTSVVRVNNG